MVTAARSTKTTTATSTTTVRRATSSTTPTGSSSGRPSIRTLTRPFSSGQLTSARRSPVAHRVRLAERLVLDQRAVHLEIAADDVVRLEDAAAEVDRDGAPELGAGVGRGPKEGRQVVHRDRQNLGIGNRAKR